MVKVKICGLTNPEDILFIESFPIDYLGFIMYQKSPRYVGKNLKSLLELPKKAKKVVVYVNPIYEDLKKTLDWGADLIQLHGEEEITLAQKIGLNRVIKAFRIRNSINLDALIPWKECYALLLDTYKKDIPGGTGESFNWSLAKRVVEKDFKIFLAGGLNPENILQAISYVKPYAVDLSSGLESSPGKKDHNKVKKLFEKVKGVNPTP